MAPMLSLRAALSLTTLLTGFDLSLFARPAKFEDAKPIEIEKTLQTVQPQYQPQPDNLVLYFASLTPNCELQPETMKYVGNEIAKMWVDPTCFTEMSLTYLQRYLDMPLPDLVEDLGIGTKDVNMESGIGNNDPGSGIEVESTSTISTEDSNINEIMDMYGDRYDYL